MTTHVSAPVAWGVISNNPTDDATTRLRIQHVHDAILAAGLVQTSDTGQLVPSAATTPAASSSSGFTIYRFNDSRQGVDPLFMRVDWFVGTFSRRFAPRITTGTGSNGSGTLTGQVSVQHSVGGSTNGTSGTITALQTYACHTEGFFGIVVGPNNTPNLQAVCAWTVTRTKDSSNAFDARGNLIWGDNGWGDGGGRTNFTRTAATTFSGNLTNHYCIAPGLPSPAQLLNGDYMLYPFFYADPEVKQSWSQFAVGRSLLSNPPSSFLATPQYGDTRTFITSHHFPSAEPNSTGFRLAFLWE